jgi:hypothetical protein
MRPPDLDAILDGLAGTPERLASMLAGLSAAEAAAQGPGGTFSPVETAWHLADLEREGFGARIRRLITEEDPALPDFDGARVARERRYATLGLQGGISSFRAARVETVAALRRAGEADWGRGGTLAGVGRVTLGDVPAMMAGHDAGHLSEMEAWLSARRT